MTLEFETVPCLSDNYAYLVHDPATGATAAVDVPEAGPILEALKRRGWTLTDVLLTHHHWDHVDGLSDLLEAAPARVVGAKADEHRLPPLNLAVREGDRVMIGDEAGEVIDVSGHTVGHIAFHFPDSKLAFTADSLMALGCGRVFEGTMPQMWKSLSKLAALPEDTVICSGHEYTAANAKFALSIDPGNARLISRAQAVDAARAKGEPTVPSVLSEELATNPFLRAGDPQLQAALGMTGADPAEVFAEIRNRKDRF
ncbi:hydroxyacylglutathione hydrolase [Roseovarius sp. A21]|uniref:Hydroxyacylglutathione hydrolase n=1 Tax=Roseovarius bejariae TaxID=2576383 RepID=A0A844CNI2_9RHOB|nr:hydroxyacylglutathione hydrolase [Roseovarius bejariae]MRU15025.1 hydroxyacylglutathione hydrolase [Roseovarius bejariae]